MDEWTVTYLRYGSEGTAEFGSLRSAVGFACGGEEDWKYSATKITGPGGVVLDGDALDQAKRRFELPEVHGDLDDMPLPDRTEGDDG
ncbi:hypothetical protein AB0I81_22820 [Nonomuraea sp. NPDC050404]|uniref:hypothetical protein n=1 Tax=Nonomuraea sp. NPDC050404 TaxID=3155783 RepID=UPI003409AB2E